MGLFKEFKEFAMRGNVVDLAIGVIIGAAFGAIVTSMVTDVLMQPIGLATGGLDFSQHELVLKKGTPVPGKPEAEWPDHVAIRWGKFIDAIIRFVIVAFCIFMVVKAMNRLMKKEAAAPPPPAPPTKSEVLLTEIRDALTRQRV